MGKRKIIFLDPDLLEYWVWHKEKEDNEVHNAYNMLIIAGIPFKTKTNPDPKVAVPILIDGTKEYKGLEQIKRFVKRWQKNHASQRHGCGCGSGCGCAE